MGLFIVKDYEVKAYMYPDNRKSFEVTLLAFSHGAPSKPDRYLSEMGVQLDGILPKNNAFYQRLQSSGTLSIIIARHPSVYAWEQLKSFEVTFSRRQAGGSSTQYAELHFYDTLIDGKITPVDAREMPSKPPYPRLDAVSLSVSRMKWH